MKNNDFMEYITFFWRWVYNKCTSLKSKISDQLVIRLAVFSDFQLRRTFSSLSPRFVAITGMPANGAVS